MAPPKTQLFDKTLSIIESCTTLAQLEAAKNYLELYNKRTQNAEKYTILLNLLDTRAQKLS
jgi:hypothetical protein